MFDDREEDRKADDRDHLSDDGRSDNHDSEAEISRGEAAVFDTDGSTPVIDEGSDASSALFARFGESSSARDHIVRRYYDRLLAAAQSLMGPGRRLEHSPEDLVQEAWLHLASKRYVFERRFPGSFGPFMMQRMRWIAEEWDRKGGKAKGEALKLGVTPIEPGGFDVDASQTGPASEAARLDMEEYLLSILSRVPKSYRVILKALYVEKRSEHDLAAEQSLSRETFRKKRRRALNAWKEAAGGIDPRQWI